MTASEFTDILKKESFIVFGTGFVAEMFYTALCLHGLEDHILCCMVSRPGSQAYFHGAKIRPYRETESLICLAVHESVKNEIRFGENSRVIWIYPFLHDLLFGRPAAERVLPVRDILAGQSRDFNWLSLRYGAVKGIKENDPSLQDLYRKCQRLHCSPATADRRLAHLKELIGLLEETGFRHDRPLILDEDLRVFDGMHRLACAAWMGVPALHCRIYGRSPLYDAILNEKLRLSDKYLKSLGMTEELDQLHALCRELENRLPQTASARKEAIG